ncbi:Transcriptional repressor p66 alpha [Nymphon striatum]|nr:Transcriptional repressor p66 alpha [Nymphon striatum]
MSEEQTNPESKLAPNINSKDIKSENENVESSSSTKLKKKDDAKEEMDCEDDTLDDDEKEVPMEINESIATALKNTTSNSVQWGSIEVTSIQSNDADNSKKDKDVLDLTRKSEIKKDPDSPDIIVLSDEDEIPLVNGKINGFVSHNLTDEEKAKKRKSIIKLKEELRNEEMKLILLKKLKQSQQTHQVAPPVKENYTPQNKPTVIRTNSQVNNTTPPPLVRGNQPQMQSKSIMHQTSSINIHRVHSQSGSSGNPPPLMMGPRSGSNANHSIQRNGSRASPNVSLTYTSGGGQSHSQVRSFWNFVHLKNC